MEYRERHPDGLPVHPVLPRTTGAWQRQLDLVMRQEHRAGEKLFVDFAGQTIPITDPDDRARSRQAQLFVAVLGASNYTYAEALPSQELPHWIAAHVHAFEPSSAAARRLIVPDNLPPGVTRAHRYEPELNRDLRGDGRPLRLCRHPRAAPEAPGQGEGRARRPARRALDPGRPAPPHVLLHRRGERGDRASGSRGSTRARSRSSRGRRASLFEELDRPALRPLPAQPYEFAIWKTRHGQHRLPRRGRPPLVQRALPARRRAVRHPRHGGRSSRSSTAGRRVASHRALAASSGASPPTLRTCPRRTAATPSGRPARIVAWADADRARHGRPGGRDHGVAGPTPSRASARASGSCASAAATGTSAWRPRPPGRSPSAPSRYRSVESILQDRARRPAPARRRAASRTIGDHANVRGAGYYE